MRFLKIPYKYTLTILLFLGISLAMVSWGNKSVAGDVAVIRIKYGWASEVLPIVRSMLSPNGTVTVSERINSLIIVDDQDAIKRVRAYLEAFDKPLEQVRIHVRFIENRSESDREVSARAKVSGDNFVNFLLFQSGWKMSSVGKSVQGIFRNMTERTMPNVM